MQANRDDHEKHEVMAAVRDTVGVVVAVVIVIEGEGVKHRRADYQNGGACSC